MKNIQIKCIADTKCTLGEGPVWDETGQLLYWVDILENKIFRTDPLTGAVDWWLTPEHVGFIILKKDGGLIAGLKTGLHYIELKEGNRVSSTRIDQVDENKNYIRFNDGTCDNRGRIWGCTMDMNQKDPLGKYYRYDNELNRTIVDEGYVVANGPAMSPDGQFLYTVETVGGSELKKGIYKMPITNKAAVGEKKMLIDWEGYSTVPDGVITDREGNLWVGEFGGNTLRCYSEKGELKHEIIIPGWSVTKPVFGGQELDILFVTTARYAADESVLMKYPETGGIFEIHGTGYLGMSSSYF